jgi:hypothetical protein
LRPGCSHSRRFLRRGRPNEGQAERREADTFNAVALVRRDVTLARREPSGATGTASLDAPPWRFGPGAGLAFAALPPQRSRGLPNLPGRGYEPRPGRHTPLRRQDRLRRAPLDERDGSCLAQIHFVVKRRSQKVVEGGVLPRSRIYPRSARCAQVGQARLAWDRHEHRF